MRMTSPSYVAITWLSTPRPSTATLSTSTLVVAELVRISTRACPSGITLRPYCASSAKLDFSTIRCCRPFGPSQRTLASIVMFAGFSELLLSTTTRGDGVGGVALLNRAAVSPPLNPGSPNVIGPLHVPSLRFPEPSAATALPGGSPNRQCPIGPSASTSAAYASTAIG